MGIKYLKSKLIDIDERFCLDSDLFVMSDKNQS